MKTHGYNTLATVALVCGAILAAACIAKGVSTEGTIAIASVFVGIAGTVIGRGQGE